MLQSIARAAIAAPRRVIVVALLIGAGAAVFGVPVTKNLSTGGFRDPTSQSWHASQLLTDKFVAGDMQLALAVTSDAGVGSQSARAAGDELVVLLQHLPYVTDVKSAWTVSPPAARALTSEDGK